MSEDWTHRLDFLGPEDFDDLIDAAEDTGFRFHGGFSQQGIDHDWRNETEQQRDEAVAALREILAAATVVTDPGGVGIEALDRFKAALLHAKSLVLEERKDEPA